MYACGTVNAEDRNVFTGQLILLQNFKSLVLQESREAEADMPSDNGIDQRVDEAIVLKSNRRRWRPSPEPRDQVCKIKT